MRILVTGASGLLGRAVVRELRTKPDFEVTGTALRRAGPGTVKLDLLDSAAVVSHLQTARPEVIVHCAAERFPDKCDDAAYLKAFNVDLPGLLASTATDIGAWLVYLSTDYVFDGTSPPYAVDAVPNPLNAYGHSKLDGERAVAAGQPGAAILRVPILYGEVEYLAESAVTAVAESVLKAHAAGKAIAVENWAIRFPTLVDDVAVVIRHLVERRGGRSAQEGIMHWSGNEATTKFGMAEVCCDLLGVPRATITPDDAPPSGAPRPKNAQLDCSVLESLGIGQHTSFRDGMARALAKHLPAGPS